MNGVDAPIVALVVAISGAISAVVGALVKGHYDLRNKHSETDQALKMTDRQVILEELKTLREEVRKEREMRIASQIEANDLRHRIDVMTSKLAELEAEYDAIKLDLAKCLEGSND